MSNYLNSCNEVVFTGSSGVTTGQRVLRAIVPDGALGNALKTWLARSQQRRQLASLTPRLLADIGIDAVDATAEAAKPFWVE